MLECKARSITDNDQTYTKIQIINNQIVKTNKHAQCVRK
ncbi:hypothetical protein SAMN05216490_3006 [Mucilaginibacter mallensis]|uniref:Uncharacterized protein n=1 Tax=Mucilaginibacter mallensis TaxID=652787 RepID=A0A1H1Z878_MUCMA|nr:hypothetical protein [Mucilaginibacter sp. X5P1]SDT29870.1 hypothetical protein SAMN05216490_3006 [Mucilaginibacter mallensis]